MNIRRHEFQAQSNEDEKILMIIRCPGEMEWSLQMLRFLLKSLLKKMCFECA